MDFIVNGGMGWTIPILLMGIFNVGVFIWLLNYKLKKAEINRKHLDLIIFLGSFALIYGIFGQILGLYSAAEVIQQAGEISPSLIWGGFKVSLIAPIMGFTVMLISGIMWFILRPGKTL